MIEMTFEYWNKLAHQIILISSLLSGFSIAVIANILVHDSNDRIVIYILKTATVAAGCFLVSVFAMTEILMITTPGYPMKVTEGDLFMPRIVGIITYMLGIMGLSTVISLVGWTKSRSTGIFTTAVGLFIFMMIVIISTKWGF